MPTPDDAGAPFGARYEEAIRRIDATNAEDPNIESDQGIDYPKELLYSQRMAHWLERLAPNASEPLRLAVRAQHISRWGIPRDSYPMDRDGYHRWRSDLAHFHAELLGSILRDCGYDEPTILRAASLVRKERFKTDPEAQILEDVACLVFLDSYAADFAAKHSEQKVVAILARTWKKMSPRGHKAALGAQLAPAVRALVERAVSKDT